MAEAGFVRSNAVATEYGLCNNPVTLFRFHFVVTWRAVKQHEAMKKDTVCGVFLCCDFKQATFINGSEGFVPSETRGSGTQWSDTLFRHPFAVALKKARLLPCLSLGGSEGIRTLVPIAR